MLVALKAMTHTEGVTHAVSGLNSFLIFKSIASARFLLPFMGSPVLMDFVWRFP
jgi:hypothetical protein